MVVLLFIASLDVTHLSSSSRQRFIAVTYDVCAIMQL